MRLPDGYDLEAWKEIAACAGVSTGHARRLAKREHDPLPVDYARTRPISSRAAIDAWLRRQIRPRGA